MTTNSLFETLYSLKTQLQVVLDSKITDSFHKNVARKALNIISNDVKGLKIEQIKALYEMTWDLRDLMCDQRFKDTVVLRKNHDIPLLKAGSEINEVCGSILTAYHTPATDSP